MKACGWVSRNLLAGLLALAVASLSPLSAAAQRVAPDPTKLKASESLRSVFKEATAVANRSTVSVRAEEKGTSHVVAMGTIVSADGFILTKASEILNQPRVSISLASANGAAFQTYDAKIVGYSAENDLAMLKIDATGLTPVSFANTKPPVADAPAPGAPGARGAGGAANGVAGGGRGGRGGRRGGGGGAPAGPVVMPAAITPPAPGPGIVAVNVGEWVASANYGASIGKSETQDEPFAVGVVSVARRRIPPRSGYLGVSMGDAEASNGGPGGGPDGGGARILQVIPDSAADKAGIKVDDVITGVNGKPTANLTDLKQAISAYRPGDVITVTLKRGDTTLTLRASLSGDEILDTPDQNAMSRLLGGATSGRASDFPAVFQHDTVIRPENCGGPLVDLEGHVIGINIARVGRTETYALPADLIVQLIEPMKSGKLAPVNANTPGPSTQPGKKPATLPAQGE